MNRHFSKEGIGMTQQVCVERCSTSLIIWEKIKSRTTVWSSSSTSEYLPKQREIRIVIKSKFMSPMHSETKQMNVRLWSKERFVDQKGADQEYGRQRFVSDPSYWLART